MKNKIRFIFVMSMLFFLHAFAQDTSGTGAGTGSGNAIDIAAYILTFFMSPEGVVALIMLLTGWLTTHLIMADAVFMGIHVKQWISYLVSVVICLFGFWQGLGVFQHPSTDVITLKVIGNLILQAIGYGLSANGVASLPAAQGALRFLKAKEPK